MKENQLSAKFKIYSVKVDEFKKNTTLCAAAVSKNKKGKALIQNIWFFSLDETHCAVRKFHAFSNAILTHVGKVGKMPGQHLTLSDFESEVYGNPSEELQKASATLKPKVYSFYHGP